MMDNFDDDDLLKKAFGDSRLELTDPEFKQIVLDKINAIHVRRFLVKRAIAFIAAIILIDIPAVLLFKGFYQGSYQFPQAGVNISQITISVLQTVGNCIIGHSYLILPPAVLLFSA